MAEQYDELFDIFDEDGNLIGSEKRGVVHSSGLWHRSVDVLVFVKPKNTEGVGKLLVLQQRSPKKTVCPSAWDLSCAEHLMSGETYREGAARGLKEELGLDIQLDNLRCLKGEYQFRTDIEERNIFDHEFKELWCVELEGTVDEIKMDEEEVVAIRTSTIEDILAEMEKSPETFTHWLLEQKDILKGLE